ncbi:MAG: hypothetical protein HY952_07750 [Elusimicrobia bacterium]|nr:hypothetical protein [Elusimicrobiota bacterium]
MRSEKCPYCVCRYDGEFFYYCLLRKREVAASHKCAQPALRRAAEAGER